MRSRFSLFVLLFIVGSLVLPQFAHASIPFFGPIIPTANNQCAAGWGMLIIVINNIISFFITMAIVFVAPIMIAYAGFLMVIEPVSAGGRTKAKGIILNTVIGIVVALAAWLIVDAVMAVLYNPSAVGQTWSSIINWNGTQCLIQASSLQTLDQSVGSPSITGTTANGVNTLNFGSGPCDSSTVLSGAQQGGYTLTQAQANTLACLAGPESSCGAVNKNYNWGKGSSAAGAFQVLLSTNSNCYDNSACEQVVSATGSLNCAAGFSGGNPKPDAASQTLVQKCLNAAGNPACSASAAACLLQQNKGSFSAWTADSQSSTQAQCIAQYSK